MDGDRPSGTENSVLRSEEELQVDTATTSAGILRLRKTVEEEPAAATVTHTSEQVQVDHVEPTEADSGLVETLPDGSVSIPVFEERLVIEKKLVVRERIIVRKIRVTENRQVDATLRRERVEIDADPEVASRVQDERH